MEIGNHKMLSAAERSSPSNLMKNGDVEIVNFSTNEDRHKQAFRDLNVEWISKYFEMEEADYKSLDHPKEYVLDRGGHILIAEFDGVPVGTVALIKIDGNSYEVSKMSVSPSVQGRGIGNLLMEAAKNVAKENGASRLYIESNTVLTPAITLYRKSGFIEIVGKMSSPYKRSNIQMELFL
jgi:GNAT superfamily N-acetyltransferase